MSDGHEDCCAGQAKASANWRAGGRLFFVSMFILFLELACIRWFPAHVLYLTFFTNTVLLASFLGMSVGCLAANRKESWIKSSYGLLVVGVLAALTLEFMRLGLDNIVLGNSNTTTSQVVFFGSERPQGDLARVAIPVEVLGAFFFLIIALMFVGPGQELG